MKKRLPDDRNGYTRKVTIGTKDIYLTTGEYEDGTLGEFFVKVGKQGEEDAIYDVAAIGVSIGLQHGVPLQDFVDKYKHQRMEIGGPTSDPDIPFCSSIIDWIARRLELDYIESKEEYLLIQ